MAKVTSAKKNAAPKRRVNSLKPGLRGARNMMAAQMRASTHSPAAAMRFWAGVFILIFVTIFGALWLGGYLPQLKKAGTDFKRDRLMSMGFVVDRVDVMGEGRLVEDDVRTALQIYRGEYFFKADLKEAKARVESLSWVDHALVRRLWPNRVVVQIIERKPYALWQNDGHIQLIDAEGTVITGADPKRFAGLDLIVGQAADKAAPQFQAQLSQFPDLSARAGALIYVNESRWDIYMDDRQTLVKLPAKNHAAALTRLNELQQQYRVLDREIGVIDLRLSGRITLTPAQAPKERA